MKWGKLKNEECFMCKLIEVVNELSYLWVTLENTGGWNKHKVKQIIKEKQSLVAVDKCLLRTPDMWVKLLENMYMK